jgi:hypothetical protein
VGRGRGIRPEARTPHRGRLAEPRRRGGRSFAISEERRVLTDGTAHAVRGCGRLTRAGHTTARGRGERVARRPPRSRERQPTRKTGSSESRRPRPSSSIAAPIPDLRSSRIARLLARPCLFNRAQRPRQPSAQGLSVGAGGRRDVRVGRLGGLGRDAPLGDRRRGKPRPTPSEHTDVASSLNLRPHAGEARGRQ